MKKMLFFILILNPFCSIWGQSILDSLNEDMVTIRLLEGDNSDPSIIRCGHSYYMVHSSFVYTPGLVVYKSKDLVNWNFCSTALDSYIGDVWAPDIVYYKNRFYIYFPTRTTNMVVYSDNPEGPWSEPIDLNIKGIDPEHIVDSVGKRYLLLNSGTLYRLSDDGCKILDKTPKQIYNGWNIPKEWDIEGFSLEGLNVKKVGKYYYLLAAEGGTAGPPTSHMVIQARSKTIEGPWENSDNNPLLRTYSRYEKWWSKGHGSIVDTPDGRIFMVFHAYKNNMQTLGRQTLIRELSLGEDGWLHLVDSISLPLPLQKEKFKMNDIVWQIYRENKIKDRFDINVNEIKIKAKGKSPKDSSPILARISASSYEMETCLTLEDDNTSAGLIAFYDENYHFGFGFNHEGLLRYRRGQIHKAKFEFQTQENIHKMWVRMRNDRNVLSAWYSLDRTNWYKYPWGFDISGVHHNTLYGFLFVRPSIFAGGKGYVKVTDFCLSVLENN